MDIAGIIQSFGQVKVLVIGDVMVDRYIWGNVARISPEAPVPIVDVTRESENLGAAGNVANNIHGLGARAMLVGVVGDDEDGEKVRQILKQSGMDTSGIFTDHSRPTTTKTRLVVEKLHQQIARVDREKTSPISMELRNKICDFVKSVGNEFDAILFQDYDKGVLSGSLIKEIMSFFESKIIAVDPKFNNFFEYKGVTLFKPNRNEIERAMGVRIDNENVKSVIRQLREKLECKFVLLTLGERGMILAEADGEYAVPTKVRQIYDESGAGDSTISAVTIALASGASLKEAAVIGNLAGGLAVEKFGAVPVTYDEMLSAIQGEAGLREFVVHSS
jgi:rfaE bifunctional protein kinase chain/domain